MKTILSIFIIIIFSMPYQLLAEGYCGDVSARAWDYTNPAHRKLMLSLVEEHHFFKQTKQLIATKEYPLRSIAADLSYTLNMFPNHFPALSAMSKLAIREKTNQPGGLRNTVICFFDRAIRFKPNDAMTRSIFGGHLLKVGQSDMAMEQLIIAAELEPNNPTFNYNLGLLYFDNKNYVEAKNYANKAYSQSFPLPGLMNKLKSVGKW